MNMEIPSCDVNAISVSSSSRRSPRRHTFTSIGLPSVLSTKPRFAILSAGGEDQLFMDFSAERIAGPAGAQRRGIVDMATLSCPT